MKEIKLIPELDACDFSDEMEEELLEQEIYTHSNNDILYVEWDGEYPETEKCLIDLYGKDIKQYTTFVFTGT